MATEGARTTANRAHENKRKKTTDPAAERPKQALPKQEGTGATGTIDIPYLVLTLLLVAVGLLMLFSASYARALKEGEAGSYYFMHQGIVAVVGIAIMLAAAFFRTDLYYHLALPTLAVSVVLLVLVMFIGRTVNGAKRWIDIGSFSLQPSEIAKLGLVLTFAVMMSAWKERMDTFTYGVIPFAVIIGVLAALLYKEPHLSATIIIIALGLIMMFMGGTKIRWLVLLVLLGALAVLIYFKTKGYTNDRIQAWLHPEDYADNEGYQIIQSRLAIGSGGFFGLGFGKGRQKYLYLPEEHNDYIFAIVCEELGFIGALGILALFALLIARGYWIALHARDRFASLVAAGLTTQLALQVLLNVMVVSNMLPPTGISLPFFSYGGTALLLQLGEMGIVLGISRWCTDKELWRKKKA